ncbi:MAG TPA: hypothetical protein VGM06_25485 [Polyangiaceae bacterium]
MKRTYEERYAAEQERARKRGNARRSQNTRRRTVEDVRMAVRDAAVQVRALGRRTDRDDLRALGEVLDALRMLVSKAPTSKVGLMKEFARLEMCASHYTFGEPKVPRERGVWHPWASVTITHEGLDELRRAVQDRVAAGILPPAPVPKPAPAPQRPKGPLPGWVRSLLDDALAGDPKEGDPCEG